MRRRWLGVLAIVVVVVAFVAFSFGGRPARVATFNIEFFPQMDTDLERVAATLAELDADVIGVQEIREEVPLQWVLDEASRATGRDYRVVLSPCLGRERFMTNGLVWDASAWTLVEMRHYPGLQLDGQGSCGEGQPGVLGVFDDGDGTRFAVLAVHLPALPARYDLRRALWPRVLAIQAQVQAELDIPVLALGDFNSTGPLDDRDAERRFIEEIVDNAGYDLLTEDIACTEYWRAEPEAYHPSVLDHIVATHGDWSAARPTGYCPRVECRPVAADDMDPDYFRVSDHCPVIVDGRL